MLKRFRAVFVTVVTILALVPTPAHAIPRIWRNAPNVTQGAVTYKVTRGMAVVTKCHGQSVTIPKSIRHKGRTYKVLAIWDGGLRGVRKLNLKAGLETCEDARLWKISVTTNNMAAYKWLKRTHAHVRFSK